MQTEESASLGVSTHVDASARSQLSTALSVKLQLVLKQMLPAARSKSAAVNTWFFDFATLMHFWSQKLTMPLLDGSEPSLTVAQ